MSIKEPNGIVDFIKIVFLILAAAVLISLF